MGPKGVLKLSQVQLPTYDVPLDEHGQGQFRHLLDHSQKHFSTIGTITGGTKAFQAILVANLAAQSKLSVLLVSSKEFNDYVAGDLANLFAKLQSDNVILFFDDADILLDETMADFRDVLDRHILLKLASTRQGLTLFSVSNESVVAAMKLRSDHFIDIKAV